MRFLWINISAAFLLLGCDADNKEVSHPAPSTDEIIGAMETTAKKNNLERAKECRLNLTFGPNGELIFNPPLTKSQEDCFSGDWVTSPDL